MTGWASTTPPPQDVAERLTRAGVFRVSAERVPLGDVETVRRWLRELDPDLDHQVHIRRAWGVIAAVSDHRHPVGVLMADADSRSWAAYPPGGGQDADLTPEQVEFVMLEGAELRRAARLEWRRLD